jgi:hypothetical protein
MLSGGGALLTMASINDSLMPNRGILSRAQAYYTQQTEKACHDVGIRVRPSAVVMDRAVSPKPSPNGSKKNPYYGGPGSDSSSPAN